MLRHYRNYLKYKRWVKDGKHIPSHPYVKQYIVRKLAKRFSLPIFIETGTYLGDMVETVKDVFEKIYSIELQQNLFENAKLKFSKYRHVEIIQGDSAVKIHEILSRINEPCFFWLDGHYSGDGTAKGNTETPILEELQHIFDHHQKGHVIMVDDAKDFTGKNDYPTIEELKAFVKDKRPDYSFSVDEDIIRLHH